MIEKNEKKSDVKDRFKRIKAYLRRYKRYLYFGSIAVIGANLLILINPYILKIAFDKLEAGAQPSDILPYALLMVGLAFCSGIFRFAMRRTVIWMSRKIEFDLRTDLFAHLLKLDSAFYSNTRTGDIMARATNDIEAVRMMIGPGIMHVGNAIVSTIIAVSFMAALSPKLTLYSMLPPGLLIRVARRPELHSFMGSSRGRKKSRRAVDALCAVLYSQSRR